MSANGIIIRSDVESIISTFPDEYENNLQQELEELILAVSENEDESEDEDQSVFLDNDDEEADGSAIQSEIEIEHFDRNYLNYDNACTKSQSDSSDKTILYLTQEEQDVIDNCTDPQLKQLLLLNRTKAVHIKELCRKLYQLYDEINKDIRKEKEKLRQEVTKIKENPEVQSMAKTYIWRVGIPYFKDKGFFSAPPNKDFYIKRENKEFYTTKVAEGRKWTLEDQQILQDSVIESYFKHRERQLEQDIRIYNCLIKNTINETEKAEAMAELEVLKKKLDTLRSELLTEPPPLNCDEGIDWLKIANTDLKGRHTYLECKAFWNIYKHPSINKTDWQPEENERIKELAIQYNYDWDVIAKELKTNRSGYLVCIHYNTKLCDKFKRERFLPEEDEFLMEVVENCRLGDYIPWGRVAFYFEDRSKHQLYHRYRYYLACKDSVKKGWFTEAEDILLTHLAERFGRDFAKISEFIPQRTSIQLRNRYSNYLDKLGINLGNFTCADDEKILHHVRVHGEKNWSAVAKQLKRNRAHVRQRYLTLQKFFERDPDMNVETLPRRKQEYLSRCQIQRNSRLITCLEKLRELKGIPTLNTVETFLKQIHREFFKNEKQWRVVRVAKKKTHSPIDNQLIEFFKGSCKVQREKKFFDEREVMESARRIIKLYDVLGSDVNLLEQAELDDVSFMPKRDDEILSCIKKIYQKNKLDPVRGRNSFILETLQPSCTPAPSASCLDHLAVDQAKHPAKHLLAPNVNTILGLRALIIRYEIYKTSHKDLTFVVKLESSKTGPANPVIWRIEQNLLDCDTCTREKLTYERDIYFSRFCAVFKWACLISRCFPEQLIKEPQPESEEEDVIEEQQEKRRVVGRPTKKVYDKVMKMVEARKRKRLRNSTGKTTPDDADKPMGDGPDKPRSDDADEPTENDDSGETDVKKQRKGRPPTKLKSEHAVAYIPRRSYVKNVKINKEHSIRGEEPMDVDDPAYVSGEATMEQSQNVDCSIGETVKRNENAKTVATSNLTVAHQNVNDTSATPTSQRVINIADLKLFNPNAVIIGKDKINSLIKLNMATNAKKIIVLPSPVQKDVVNSNGIITTSRDTPPDVSHTQNATTQQSQQKVLSEVTYTHNNAFVETSEDNAKITANQEEPPTQSYKTEPCRSARRKNISPLDFTNSDKTALIQSQENKIAQSDHLIESFEQNSGADQLKDPAVLPMHCEQNISAKLEPLMHDPDNHENELSKLICINKKLWDKHRKKWKNLNLPEEEMEMLEQDLDSMEQEAKVVKDELSTAEQNRRVVDFENMEVPAEVKRENGLNENDDETRTRNVKTEKLGMYSPGRLYDEMEEWEESEEEIDMNDEFSKQYMEEFVRGIDDGDCNDEALKAKFEQNRRKHSKTVQLSKTIEKIRAKLRESKPK